MSARPADTVLRALDRFAVPPRGCIAHVVRHAEYSPHLFAGEMAIVDPADVAPQHGEFFLVAFSGALGGASRQETILKVLRFDERMGSVDFADGWGGEAWILAPPVERVDRINMVHGPYGTPHLAAMLLGRVIGYCPAGGEERE